MAEQVSHDVLMRAIASDQHENNVATNAKALGIEYADLRKYAVSPTVLDFIDRKDAQMRKVIIFRSDAGLLSAGVIAFDDSTKQFLKDLAKRTNLSIEPYLISDTSLAQILAEYEIIAQKRSAQQSSEVKRENVIKTFAVRRIDAEDFKQFQAMLGKGTTEQQLTTLLAGALSFGASDIHVEPGPETARIRLRIDGILHEAATLTMKSFDSLLTRMKFFAKLKLNTPEPQDGRVESNFENTKIDFRVSTIPAVHGENVTIRVLKTTADALNLQDLGLSHHDFGILRESIKRPRGMILVTGPTGHGKTTTIYAILNALNSPKIKISTLEDPVEYTLPGAIQSAVNESTGFTFAKGIRALLRQNPDIIMIGEIRDPESADTAFRAALSGHIAFSTYHAGEAVAVIPSMVEMGVKSFLAASALSLIIAQRLVRKVCTFCKQELKAVPEIEKTVKDKLSTLPKDQQPNLGDLTFYKGAGCDKCHGLGYLGQIGVFELMKVTPELVTASTGDKDLNELLGIAQSQGMITMEQDGYLKALKGMTTLEEIWRVVGLE